MLILPNTVRALVIYGVVYTLNPDSPSFLQRASMSTSYYLIHLTDPGLIYPLTPDDQLPYALLAGAVPPQNTSDKRHKAERGESARTRVSTMISVDVHHLR